MTCETPIYLKPWQSLSNQRLSATMETVESTGDDTVVCDTSKLTKPEDLTTCESYTSWSQAIGGAGGLILSTASIVDSVLEKKGEKDLAENIWDGFGTIYNAIDGVNKEFLQAIKDINAGKPFEPIEAPDNLPDWPSHQKTDTDGSNAKSIIQGIWATLKPILQVALQKMPSGSNWKVVLEGLINSGDSALNQLLPLLEKAFG